MEVFRPEGAVADATGTVRAFEILGFGTGVGWELPLISAHDGEITVIDYEGDFSDPDKPCKEGCISIKFSPTVNEFGINPGCCSDLPNGQGRVTDIAGVPLSKVNDSVTFEPDSSTYSVTSPRHRCPNGYVGVFGFEAQLTNVSQSALSDLHVQVAELSNGNLLITPAGPTGAGGVLSVPTEYGYSDGILSPGEYVHVPFDVCLVTMDPFRFFVDVVGVTGGPALTFTPVDWTIDLDTHGEGIHTIFMIADVSPMTVDDLQDLGGKLIWEGEVEINLCMDPTYPPVQWGKFISIRDVGDEFLRIGDGFQTNFQGAGCDINDAMQNAFVGSLPETACLSVRSGDVDHAFCAPLNVIQ